MFSSSAALARARPVAEKHNAKTIAIFMLVNLPSACHVAGLFGPYIGSTRWRGSGANTRGDTPGGRVTGPLMVEVETVSIRGRID